MNRPPTTFPQGVFSLRSFVQEYRPIFEQLLENKLGVLYPAHYEWMVEFERWLICRSLEDNFLLMIVNYDRHQMDFEEAVNSLTPVMPQVQSDLRAMFTAYVRMHQMPGIVKVRYDGGDVYITNLDQ